MLNRQLARRLGLICFDESDDTGSGAGTSSGSTTSTTGDPAGDDDAAAKARRESAELRRRLKAAETERDQLKNASLTEQERAQARADKAEQQARAATERLETASLKAEVGLLAGKVGIRPDATAAALKLVDRESITFADGEADKTSVERALRSLIKEHPFLAGAGRADAGESGDRTAAPSMGSRINAALRRPAA